MVTYKSDSAVVRFFCCFSSSNRCTDFATPISTYAWCVIASILAVASVTATAVATGLALHQGIQTADFIWDWHKDSHLLWQQQRGRSEEHTSELQSR